MKRIQIVCLLILLCVLSLSAKEKWTKVEMTDFTSVGTVSETEMKSLGNKLEKFRYTLAALLPNAKLNSAIPTTIYLFKSYDDFHS